MARPSQLFNHTAWNAAGKLAQFLINLVSLALIARFVGPQAYGVVALSWVLIGLFDIFVTASPTETLVQRTEVRPGHLNASFVLPMAVSLAAWAALWFWAAPAARFLNGGSLFEQVLPWRGACVPLSALVAVPTAVLMRRSDFRAIATAESAAAVAASLTGVGLALSGAGVWSLVAMELVRGAVHAALAIRAAGWRPGWRFSVADVRELAAYNVNTWGSYGLGYLEQQLPRVIIGRMLDAQAVGLFALAQRLFTESSRILSLPVYQVVISGAARVSGSRRALRRMTRGALQATTLVGAPIFVGLAATAQLLVPLFFGAQWAGAVPVAQALLLLGLRNASMTLQAAVLRGSGVAHWHLFSVAVGIALTALMVGAAAPFGVAAVAWALLVRSYLLWPIAARMLRRRTGLALAAQFRAGAPAAAAAIVMGLIVWLEAGVLAGIWPRPLALAASVATGVGAYLASLRLFAPVLFVQLQGVAHAVARRDAQALRGFLDGSAAPDTAPVQPATRVPAGAG